MSLAGRSGLQPTSSSKQGASMLHQPHQAGFTDPGDLYIRQYLFQTHSMGAVNEVSFTNIPMVLSDAWVTATMTLANGSNQSDLPPMAYWLSYVGCILRHEGQEVMRLTLEEAITWNATNSPGHLREYYEIAETYFNRAAKTTNSQYKFRLSLRPIIERLMQNFGPLKAYAAGKWSLALGLKSVAEIQEVDTDLWTLNATGLSLTLMGHREDDTNTNLISLALAERGLNIIAEWPFQITKTLAQAAGVTAPAEFAFNSLSGDMVGIVLLFRNTTDINAATASKNARSTIDFGSVDATRVLSDAQKLKVRIGTSGSPDEYLGQPISAGDLAVTAANYSVDYTQQYRSLDLMTAVTTFPDPLYVTTLSPSNHQLGTLVIPMSAKYTMDQRTGMYNGMMPIRQNLIVQVVNDSGASLTAASGYTITCIVYCRRSVLVTHGGVQVVNAYAAA